MSVSLKNKCSHWPFALAGTFEIKAKALMRKQSPLQHHSLAPPLKHSQDTRVPWKQSLSPMAYFEKMHVQLVRLCPDTFPRADDGSWCSR